MPKNNESAPAPQTERWSGYVVQEDASGNNQKPIWHRVATVFPHGNGNGFNVELPPGVSLTGRLVIRKDLPREAGNEG